MPKRSNDFQRLVFLLKKQFADRATVSESKFLTDFDTGASREVDVVLEGRVAGEPVIVSIECVDTGRKAGVQWVEQMCKKHERLPTNQLVLASRRGFCASAIQKARANGIKTISYDTVGTDELSHLFSHFDTMIATSVGLHPQEVRAAVVRNGSRHVTSVGLATSIFAADASPVTNVASLVDQLTSYENVGKRLLDEVQQEHKVFRIYCGYQEQGLFLRDDDRDELWQLIELEVTGELEVEQTTFPLEHAVIDATRIMWGKGSFLGGEAMIVTSGDAPEQIRFTINVHTRGGRSG